MVKERYKKMKYPNTPQGKKRKMFLFKFTSKKERKFFLKKHMANKKWVK